MPLNSMPITDWSGTLTLDSDVGNRPGRLHLDAYQKAVLTALADPTVRQVDVLWASQTGKTLTQVVYLSWMIDCQPLPVMMMLPTVDAAIKFSRDKLDPIFRVNRKLDAKIHRRYGTQLSRKGFKFDGGQLTFATSRGTSDAHGTTAAVVLADEVDDYPNPYRALDDLRQRMTTYLGDARQKLVLTSTPTDLGRGAIHSEYLKGSQTAWAAVCPFCAHPQVLAWEQVNRRFSVIICVACGTPWEEMERRRAVETGHPVDLNPNPEPGHRSFHLSQLYSANVNLADTVKEAGRCSERHLYTQILAEPYRQVESPPPDRSASRRQPCPFIPVWTTVGVDVQVDRLEYSVLKWDQEVTLGHLLDRGHIYRDAGAAAWRELKVKLAPHQPHKVFVDGAYNFDYVDGGLRAHFLNDYVKADGRIKICRGQGGKESPSFDEPLCMGTTRRGAIRVAVDEAKSLLYNLCSEGRLTIEPDLARNTEDQLFSEHLIPNPDGRRYTHYWSPIRRGIRNEVLDCCVYALAAVHGFERKTPRRRRRVIAG